MSSPPLSPPSLSPFFASKNKRAYWGISTTCGAGAHDRSDLWQPVARHDRLAVEHAAAARFIRKNLGLHRQKRSTRVDWSVCVDAVVVCVGVCEGGY